MQRKRAALFGRCFSEFFKIFVKKVGNSLRRRADGFVSLMPVGRANVSVLFIELKSINNAQRFVNIASERKVVDNLVADDALPVNQERSAERDAVFAQYAVCKRDVFIDDNKVEQDRTNTKNRRAMGMTDADRAATAASVVYEAEGTDAEAVSAPRLMDDTKTKKTTNTPTSPTLMPTTPSGGATPPPPPSFSSGAGATSSSSSGSKTDNSVPQLF